MSRLSHCFSRSLSLSISHAGQCPSSVPLLLCFLLLYVSLLSFFLSFFLFSPFSFLFHSVTPTTCISLLPLVSTSLCFLSLSQFFLVAWSLFSLSLYPLSLSTSKFHYSFHSFLVFMSLPLSLLFVALSSHFLL